MILDQHGKPIKLDGYKGETCFLICGGKSFADVDSTLLKKHGVFTAAVNNAPKSYRPDLWFSVDDPSHFLKSVWFDPRIVKFCYHGNRSKHIFDSDTWKFTDRTVQNCPNVHYYQRNDRFNPDTFLSEETFNWGNDEYTCSTCFKKLPNWAQIKAKKERKPPMCPSCATKWDGGGRSVMLAALKGLNLLGFSRVYLLGVDFQMSQDNTYHFEQTRTRGSVHGNNATYQKLNRWFSLLRPIFDKHNFQVFNCNPASGLKAFEFVDYHDAVSTPVLGTCLMDERTDGLYDRVANERHGKRKVQVFKGNKWQDIRFKKLRPKDRFRMYEPNGQPVVDLGVTEWIVQTKPIKQADEWICMKTKP